MALRARNAACAGATPQSLRPGRRRASDRPGDGHLGRPGGAPVGAPDRLLCQTDASTSSAAPTSGPPRSTCRASTPKRSSPPSTPCASIRLARVEGATIMHAYLARSPPPSPQRPLPARCLRAMPLLEAIEQRARALGRERRRAASSAGAPTATHCGDCSTPSTSIGSSSRPPPTPASALTATTSNGCWRCRPR
jgi:hypothetical protein